MNKNWVIFSVVTSLISALYLIMQYYGWVRFCKVHYNKCEAYVNDYKETPRVDYKGKVIISCYTEEPDLTKIKPFINSILDQTVHVDQIALNLSDKINYTVPDFIKNTDFITIYNIPQSYGESTKLIAPLLREKNGDCLILCLNDQVVYGKDFIESVIEQVNNNKDCVVCFSPSKGKVLDLTYGIAIKPNQLGSDILETADKGPARQTDDFDVWLSVNLIKNKSNVKIMDYDENFKTFGYNKEQDGQLRQKLLQFYAVYL